MEYNVGTFVIFVKRLRGHFLLFWNNEVTRRMSVDKTFWLLAALKARRAAYRSRHITATSIRIERCSAFAHNPTRAALILVPSAETQTNLRPTLTHFDLFTCTYVPRNGK